jgi:hypothetical protein
MSDETNPGERLAGKLRKLLDNVTPGPWRAYKPRDGHKPALFVARNLGEIDDARPHWYVASIYAGHDAEANGELVATAADPVFVRALVELLEAADVVVRLVGTHPDTVGAMSAGRLDSLGRRLANLERAAEHSRFEGAGAGDMRVEVLEVSGDSDIDIDVRLRPTGVDPNGPCTVAPDELGPDEVTERRDAYDDIGAMGDVAEELER